MGPGRFNELCIRRGGRYFFKQKNQPVAGFFVWKFCGWVVFLSADDLYVYGVFTFAAIYNVEGYKVVLLYLIDEACLMNKNFFISSVFNYKTETFCGIEKFYFTRFHCNKNDY